MTQTVFEPVQDVLETPELPEVMTTTNSPVVGESIPAQMQRKLVEGMKQGPYVFRCSEKGEDYFASIYPPNIAECKQLPGQGKPFWIYEFNYCIDCHATLESCKSNPYGFHGAIGKARRAAMEEHRIKALIEKQAKESVLHKAVVPESETSSIVSGGVNSSEDSSDAPKRRGRRALSGISREVSEEQKPLVRAAYLEFKTLAQVAEEFKINPVTVRQFILSEGIMRAKGSHLRTGSPNQPVIVRRGKPRSTVEVSPEIVKKALAMFKKGSTVGALAVEFNVIPMELSAALKLAGADIRKGKTRTTVDVTPALVAKAMKMFKKGKGVSLIAGELNVNPMKLSTAMKEAGADIHKGKKKVA